MNNKKFVLGFILGALIFGTLGVYAAKTILASDVTYNNANSNISSTNVQGALDQIYDKFVKDTCYSKSTTKYKENILNGADPVLGEGMIPVTIDKNGKVYYANINSSWYEYGQKQWANAVLLVDSPSKTYKECDEIKNSDIKGYFVWVPRFKYKIWDTGSYTTHYLLTNLTDTNADPSTNVRHIANKARTIDVVFESTSTTASNGSTVGSYLTHPAFTSFNVNGLWVAKFETTGSISAPTVKPSEAAVVNQTTGSFWTALYNFNRANDSHMMKNTEWGAAAYLSHSTYGINKEITINNNQSFLTGYAAAVNTDQSSYQGEYGDSSDKTLPWTTLQGYTASTTGNISGIYGMSGGAHEYMAAYLSGYGVKSSGNVESGFTSDPATQKGAKYFDVYSNSANTYYGYNNRKLADATGEMGPFYRYYDKDGNQRNHNSWYGDFSYFVDTTGPWFLRGGACVHGVLASQFSFVNYTGGAHGNLGARLVLAV